MQAHVKAKTYSHPTGCDYSAEFSLDGKILRGTTARGFSGEEEAIRDIIEWTRDRVRELKETGVYYSLEVNGKPIDIRGLKVDTQ